MDTGDARADAKEDATMALDRASSPIPPDSWIALELLLYDATEIDPILGVFARTRGDPTPAPTGFFLIDPATETTEDAAERLVEDRGGSTGLKSSLGTAGDRDVMEGWGLGAVEYTLLALDTVLALDWTDGGRWIVDSSSIFGGPS